MISLIHPSRGRPLKAYQTSRKWLDNAGCDVEYILSLDKSDPTLSDYAKRFPHFILNDNSCVVEATNHAAAISTGDILIYLSDDFDCFPDWGKAVENAAREYPNEWLMKVDDCLQRFEVAVLTIPIMSRALYKRLGYFWHPGYKSMFVDEDLYWTATKLGALQKAPWLKFPHNHCSVGKAQDDETYRNSAKNWDQGQAFFRQRQKQYFPL